MRSNKVSREKGAALVEFALIFPILLLLLMGIVEFGLLFYNKQVLTNASREGARAGIAYAPKANIETIVVNYCADRLIRFDTTVDPVPTVLPNPLPSSYGQNLFVTVSYDYTFLVPQVLGFGPGLQLKAETVMKMESVEGP